MLLECEPQVADFLECKLQDDIPGERVQLGLAGPIWRWAPHGQVRSHLVKPEAQGAEQEELRLQVFQVQRELQEIDITTWDIGDAVRCELEATRPWEDEEEED